MKTYSRASLIASVVLAASMVTSAHASAGKSDSVETDVKHVSSSPYTMNLLPETEAKLKELESNQKAEVVYFQVKQHQMISETEVETTIAGL